MFPPSDPLSLAFVRHPLVGPRPQPSSLIRPDQARDKRLVEDQGIEALDPAGALGLRDVHELVPKRDRCLTRVEVRVQPNDPGSVAVCDQSPEPVVAVAGEPDLDRATIPRKRRASSTSLRVIT